MSGRLVQTVLLASLTVFAAASIGFEREIRRADEAAARYLEALCVLETRISGAPPAPVSGGRNDARDLPDVGGGEDAGELAARRPIGVMKITGYDPFCAHCCGKADGITASGALARVGVTAAASGLPFGTVVEVAGLGRFVIEDRGVPAGVLDLALADHAACYAVTGEREVFILDTWEEGESGDDRAEGGARS